METDFSSARLGEVDIEEIAEIMNENITKALDECAAFKTITIRHSYRCGKSNEKKEQINKEIVGAVGAERSSELTIIA
jgi:hypothetical protein